MRDPQLLLAPLLRSRERRELCPSKGQQLGKLQAWATSSPVLSSSVHKNTVCGCERGPVGTILSENTGEQLYWLQKTHARWLC